MEGSSRPESPQGMKESPQPSIESLPQQKIPQAESLRAAENPLRTTDVTNTETQPSLQINPFRNTKVEEKSLHNVVRQLHRKRLIGKDRERLLEKQSRFWPLLDRLTETRELDKAYSEVIERVDTETDFFQDYKDVGIFDEVKRAFRFDRSKDSQDLLMDKKDDKKRETKVSWANPYWWMEEDTFMKEMFFYMPVGSNIYLAGDRPNRDEMLFSLASFGDVPWGSGAYLHEKIHSLQEPHMSIKRAAYLILLARNKNPKGELYEAQAYRASGAPINLISAEDFVQKIQEYKIDEKKKAYPYIKPQRLLYAFNAIDKLNALGMNQKDIAEFIHKSPGNWDTERKIYPDIQAVIDSEATKRGLDGEGMKTLVDDYRRQKQATHEKVRSITQEILQSYVNKVDEKPVEQGAKKNRALDFFSDREVSLKPLGPRMTEETLNLFRHTENGEEYVKNLYDEITDKAKREKRRNERFLFDTESQAQASKIKAKDDFDELYKLMIMHITFRKGIDEIDRLIPLREYIDNGFAGIDKKTKKKLEKAYRKHPVELPYIKAADASYEEYQKNMWPDKQTILYAMFKDGDLPLQVEKYIHTRIDEENNKTSWVGKLFRRKKKHQELKEAQAYRASFFPVHMASRTELAAYMLNAVDEKGKHIHKNMDANKLLFAIDAIDFFNAFGTPQEVISKIIKNPGMWNKEGQYYRNVMKEIKKRVSRLEKVVPVYDLELYEKPANEVKIPDIIQKMAIEDAMFRLYERDNIGKLTEADMEFYKINKENHQEEKAA